MNLRRRRFRLETKGFLAFLVLWACSVFAISERFEFLEIDGSVYREAVVRSVDASFLTIQHAKGLSQIALSELPPELQMHYGFDEQADIRHRAKLENERAAGQRQTKEHLEALCRAPESGSASPAVGSAIHRFGSAAELRTEVDLREDFVRRGVSVRNQGRRPSCAIHAVVGALEYQLGGRSDHSTELSEYYLHWATLKTLGHYDFSRAGVTDDPVSADAGFRLVDVFLAVRAYGLIAKAEAPKLHYGSENGFPGDAVPTGMAAIPTKEQVERARKRSRVAFQAIPGRSVSAQISNIVHALNDRQPVVIGLAWPTTRSIWKTALISKQTPREDYAHAVALVGYRCPSGRLEDTTFIFRNSWGIRWGAGGYGFVRYDYLKKNLMAAYILDIGAASFDS